MDEIGVIDFEYPTTLSRLSKVQALGRVFIIVETYLLHRLGLVLIENENLGQPIISMAQVGLSEHTQCDSRAPSKLG